VVLPSLLDVFFHLAKFGKDREGAGQIDERDQRASQYAAWFKSVDDCNHAGRHKPDHDRVKKVHLPDMRLRAVLNVGLRSLSRFESSLVCPIVRCRLRSGRLAYFGDDRVSSYRSIYPALLPGEYQYLVK
jgi:hypothetical protein